MIKMDKLVEAISSFIKDKFDVMKGDIIEKISSIISRLITFFILFLILMFLIGFLSIAAANLINDFTQNSYIGYLAVGIFYLMIFIGLYKYSKTGKLKDKIESEFLKGLK